MTQSVMKVLQTMIYWLIVGLLILMIIIANEIRIDYTDQNKEIVKRIERVEQQNTQILLLLKEADISWQQNENEY